MTETTNYGLNIAEGSDLYNHLTIDNPNYTKIDTQMKTNEVNGIPGATELTSGTVHTITRNKPDAPMFHFTATSNWTSGDTMTVDGTQVTVLLPNGATLTTGAYIIGAEVIGILVGTRVTVFLGSGTIEEAEDAKKLGGELPSYYGTAEKVSEAIATAQAASTIAQGAQTKVSQIGSRSTEEVMIGTDTDGKALYKRTFIITVSTSTTEGRYKSFTASNSIPIPASKMRSVNGIAELRRSGGNSIFVPFGHTPPDNLNGTVADSFRLVGLVDGTSMGVIFQTVTTTYTSVQFNLEFTYVKE